MLHLHGTRKDSKIWAKIMFAPAKKSSGTGVSIGQGRWVGQEGNSELELSRRELIKERSQVWRSLNTMLNTQGYHGGL